MKNSISVIIPNYNGQDLLKEYLPSVYEALNFSNITFEIIVIDDFSSDNSVLFLTQNYPDIIVLKNKKNKGFSYTCNKGIQHAKNDLVLLLNSDVKLTPNYFQNQMLFFEKDDTFGVMGRIMNFDGVKIEDAARFPIYKGTKFKANKFFYINDNQPTYTTYLSGANALIDRKKLNILSGFNEIFSPFYFEDFDLSLRAWQLGWKCYYDHQSVCFHKVSASTKLVNKSNWVKIIYNRNSFILQSIHQNGILLKYYLLQLFSTIMIWHLLKGEFWIFKSYKKFIKSKRKILKSKIKLKNLQYQHQNIPLNEVFDLIKENTENRNVTWL